MLSISNPGAPNSIQYTHALIYGHGTPVQYSTPLFHSIVPVHRIHIAKHSNCFSYHLWQLFRLAVASLMDHSIQYTHDWPLPVGGAESHLHLIYSYLCTRQRNLIIVQVKLNTGYHYTSHYTRTVT